MTDNSNMPMNPQDPNKRTINEELEVAGNQLVDQVKQLIDQGNIRRLIIRDPNGRVNLEIPLTMGVVAGGALALLTPWLAALAVIGALVARLKIEVVREEPEATITDIRQKVDDISDSMSGQA